MLSDAPFSIQATCTLPRRGRLVHVVLLALAWLQLSFASHQFEHAVGDLADYCAVCSHFDRLEHSVAPDVDLPKLPEPPQVLVCCPDKLADPSGESAYSARAPPVV